MRSTDPGPNISVLIFDVTQLGGPSLFRVVVLIRSFRLGYWQLSIRSELDIDLNVLHSLDLFFRQSPSSVCVAHFT